MPIKNRLKLPRIRVRGECIRGWYQDRRVSIAMDLFASGYIGCNVGSIIRVFGWRSGDVSWHATQPSTIGYQSHYPRTTPHRLEAKPHVMRLIFPHYLFPSFLLRQHSADKDEPRRKSKKSRDDIIQSAGTASFAYLCCKGCHTPCTLFHSMKPDHSDEFPDNFEGVCWSVWSRIFMSWCNQRRPRTNPGTEFAYRYIYLFKGVTKRRPAYRSGLKLHCM